MTLSEKLKGITLTDSEGKPRTLGSFWAQSPAVFEFLRHFGWIACRERAAQLRDKAMQINQAGAIAVFVGCGTLEHAKEFKAGHAGDFEVLIDPKLEAYQALDFKRSIRSTINFRTLINHVRAFLAGYKAGKLQGDALQQGGTVVVRPDGSVPFLFRSKAPGHYVSFDDVLRALK